MNTYYSLRWFPSSTFLGLCRIIERRQESRSIGSDDNPNDTTLCHRLRIWPTCFAITQDSYLDPMYMYIQYAQPFMNFLAEMKKCTSIFISSVGKHYRRTGNGRWCLPHMHSDLSTHIDPLLGRWLPKSLILCKQNHSYQNRYRYTYILVME